MSPGCLFQAAVSEVLAAQVGSQLGQVPSTAHPSSAAWAAPTGLSPHLPPLQGGTPQEPWHSQHCPLGLSHPDKGCSGVDLCRGVPWHSGHSPTHGPGLMPTGGWGTTARISGFLPGRCCRREARNTLTWSLRSLRSCLWDGSNTPLPKGWLCWGRGGMFCTSPLSHPSTLWSIPSLSPSLSLSL